MDRNRGRSSSGTTVHGRDKVDERFMEIDGKITEIGGDLGGITIVERNQERETRDNILGNQVAGRVEGKGFQNVTVGMDPKRRCINSEDITEESEGEIEVGPNPKNGPKNTTPQVASCNGFFSLVVMTEKGNTWLNLPKYTKGYMDGVKLYVMKAMANFGRGDEIKFPCRKCENRLWWGGSDAESHLIWSGPSPPFIQSIYDVSLLVDKTDNVEFEHNTRFGDNLDDMLDVTYSDVGPNDDARKFYRLVDEGKQPLYPGCKNFSRLNFLVRLYHWKCLNGVTEVAFGEILQLLKEVVPDINVPSTFNLAKNIIKDLGLDYKKIDACPNECILYWGDNKDRVCCKTCGVSKWKGVEQGQEQELDVNSNRIPAKVMRFFSLIPRLQRLYMCKDFAKKMVWHAVERKKDGKLRHPADGEAWKIMDAKYPEFSSELRNVRLGIATDGFNPFCKMSATHSTWPIVVVNYNLPPWLNMKPENLILSTIIPGPNDPGNNIDVYMQPLIEELKELWKTGVETYDAATNQKFTLRASVLWKISDFPGYPMMLGWSTKGKLACPVCHYETSSMYLKHNKKLCYMNHRKFLDPNHKWRFDKRRFNGEVET
ncbi:uncharacterized protein LOC141713936 [Apium graveolens]|uniref:uncharacterized protein LOC141713936 n=1 Tax=Apium graveolens TaxID=4045 RepID=UPI003D7B3EAB